MGPDRWNWTRRDGGQNDDEAQTALLHEDHFAPSPSFSSWDPSHIRSSRSSSRSGSSSSDSVVSLLDDDAYTLDGTPPYSLKTCHNATARRKGCSLFNNLTRIPASLALYLQLQLRHRLGISFALPINCFPTRRPFRKHVVILWCICALVLIPVLLLGVVLVYGGIPPSYSAIRAAERALPQHHWDWDKWKGAKSSERVVSHSVRGAREERYLRFPDHLWGHGLNNVLQEAILTSHLTLLSNRTPVFEDYTWSHLPVQYTLYDFALRPTRIPLGAFVGGVLAGQDGVYDVSENEKRERRAISAAYFEYVCPPSETVEVVYQWPGGSDASGHTTSEEVDGTNRSSEGDTPQSVKRAASEADDETPTHSDSTSTSISAEQSTPSDIPPFPSWQPNGNEIIEWFEKRLAAADVKDKRCVVVREERRVFDSEFFGTERILAILPDLLLSPVLRQFEWSALVRGAVERNVQRFFGAKAKAISPSLPSKSAGDIDADATASPAAAQKRRITARASAPGANHTLPGVLALHLRRGDYKRHCTRLTEWGSRYMGVMSLFEDKFDGEHGRPRGSEARVAGKEESEDEKEERRTAYYLEHCLPSIQQVVLRLREVREEYEDTLRVVRRLEGDAEEEDSKEARTPRAEYALRDVYVLTNGWPSFVAELREALVADGWARVVGTPDWESAPAPVRFAVAGERTLDTSAAQEEGDEEDLNSEERGVSAAIDMGIAERAEVFVGNGFSSLSSNVIMLRLAKGLAIHSNRML